jgi:hypothetical protein
MKKEDLLRRIHAVWHDGDEFDLSVAIIELLQKLPSAKHIPMARFQSLAREKSLTKDPHLPQRVVQYLCGADSPVLNIGAELIEDDENVYQLKEEEFQLAVHHKLHPLTGQIDADLASRIYIYFYPSDYVKAIFSEDEKK